MVAVFRFDILKVDSLKNDPVWVGKYLVPAVFQSKESFALDIQLCYKYSCLWRSY